MRSSFTKIKNDFPKNMIFVDHKRFMQDYYFNVSAKTPEITDNVYKSHIEFYESLGLKKKDSLIKNRSRSSIVRVIPFSSARNKNFDILVLTKVVRCLEYFGINYEVIYLKGDQVYDLKHVHTVIEKNFYALAAKLQDAAFNISCDSLPAHLSSFYNVETLVLLPEGNLYGLPLNSYLSKNYLTFEDFRRQYSAEIIFIDRENFMNCRSRTSLIQ